MKPPPFKYHCPVSLNAAIDLLATLENAKILAGGQSLITMLNMRYVFPDHVVDLNRIDDLAYIRDEDGALAIGSMTRQRDLELSPVVRSRVPILAEALHFVGHVQTRNRGTIGGSLCHLDPSAELPAVALVHDAEVSVVGPQGRRCVAMSEFAVMSMTPAIDVNEIVVEIRLPYWSPGHGYAFEEYSRRHGDFAIASAAVLLSIGGDGGIDRASITIAGAVSKAIRISVAEQFLVGQKPESGTFERAADLSKDIDVIDDAYYTAAYRRHLAGHLVRRALARAAARTSFHT